MDFIDIGPRYEQVYERRVRSNTQFGICNFQDTYKAKGKLVDERKDGGDRYDNYKRPHWILA